MKFIKYIVLLILFLVILSFIGIKLVSKPLPDGESGNADLWTDEIQTALNKSAYDSLSFLQWEFFRAGQKYLWDKQNNAAIIEWGNNKAIMDLNTQKAVIFTDGVKQSGDSYASLKQKAWSNWCNDSFWLIAPFKMKDPNTTRKIVETEDGRKGLLVSYTGGGVTPGDSYLWEIGEDNLPTAYRMWTSIIPVKGMRATWSGWEEHSGIKFSTEHVMAGITMTMKNVKTGRTLSDLGYEKDPFAILN